MFPKNKANNKAGANGNKSATLQTTSDILTSAYIELASAAADHQEEEVKGEVAMSAVKLQFQPSAFSDDYRSDVGHSEGGFALKDK